MNNNEIDLSDTYWFRPIESNTATVNFDWFSSQYITNIASSDTVTITYDDISEQDMMEQNMKMKIGDETDKEDGRVSPTPVDTPNPCSWVYQVLPPL